MVMMVIHYVCSISLFAIIIINTIPNIMAEEWRTPSFRENVISKINEAIASAGLTSPINGTEIENDAFLKAKTKEDYLGSVSKVIIQLRGTKNMNAQQQQQEWQTPALRQKVVSKINEAIASGRASGCFKTSSNGREMENHIFSKAKTKEEYLGFVAKLIIYMRDFKNKTPPHDNSKKNTSKATRFPPERNAKRKKKD